MTGFAAGIGMSGDLKDPRRSIPRGTLWSVVTGTAIYLLIPALLAVAPVSLGQLREPGLGVWLGMAVLGPILIYPGIWGAVLSSAFVRPSAGPECSRHWRKMGWHRVF